MPNKTIYIADADVEVFEEAQRMAGTSLSAIIVEAVRRYLAGERARERGFEEVTHVVGLPGSRRKVRFRGRLLGKWRESSGEVIRSVRVYLTERNQFAVYQSHQPNWSAWSEDWDHYPWPDDHLREHRLDVYPDLAALRQAIPGGFADGIERAAAGETVEDLDI